MDATLWRLAYQASYEAERPDPDSYMPIPPIDVPVEFSFSTIAILVTSATAPETWRVGGWVNQTIDTGLFMGSITIDVVQNKKIYLRRISVLQFPKITETYSICFFAPKWFVDINLSIWEYTGTDIGGDGSTLR